MNWRREMDARTVIFFALVIMLAASRVGWLQGKRSRSVPPVDYSASKLCELKHYDPTEPSSSPCPREHVSEPRWAPGVVR